MNSFIRLLKAILSNRTIFNRLLINKNKINNMATYAESLLESAARSKEIDVKKELYDKCHMNAYAKNYNNDKQRPALRSAARRRFMDHAKGIPIKIQSTAGHPNRIVALHAELIKSWIAQPIAQRVEMAYKYMFHQAKKHYLPKGDSQNIAKVMMAFAGVMARESSAIPWAMEGGRILDKNYKRELRDKPIQLNMLNIANAYSSHSKSGTGLIQWTAVRMGLLDHVLKHCVNVWDLGAGASRTAAEAVMYYSPQVQMDYALYELFTHMPKAFVQRNSAVNVKSQAGIVFTDEFANALDGTSSEKLSAGAALGAILMYQAGLGFIDYAGKSNRETLRQAMFYGNSRGIYLNQWAGGIMQSDIRHHIANNHHRTFDSNEYTMRKIVEGAERYIRKTSKGYPGLEWSSHKNNVFKIAVFKKGILNPWRFDVVDARADTNLIELNLKQL